MIKCESFQALKVKAQSVFDVNDFPKTLFNKLIFTTMSFEDGEITQEEVDSVLNGNHSNKEKAIKNQAEALDFIIKMVKENQDLTENSLKDLHEVLMNGILDVCGLYRNVDISVRGSNYAPPSHLKVYDRMAKYFDRLAAPFDCELEFISYSHLQLTKNHPFLDGNGRVARLVLNFELMKHGLVPVYIEPRDRQRYYECLESYKVDKDINPFMEFLLNLEETVIGEKD